VCEFWFDGGSFDFGYKMVKLTFVFVLVGVLVTFKLKWKEGEGVKKCYWRLGLKVGFGMLCI